MGDPFMNSRTMKSLFRANRARITIPPHALRDQLSQRCTNQVARFGYSHIKGAVTLVVIFAVFVATQIPGGAANFTAKGSLSYTTTTIPRGTETLHRKFEISVTDCTWTLVMELVGNKSIGRFWYRYDGTNLFSITVPVDASNRMHDSSGFVEKAEVPQAATSSGAPQVWLAYASSCYFGRLTNNLAIPVWSVENRVLRASGYTVPVAIRWSEKCPAAVERIDYFYDGKHYSEDGLPIATVYPPPYDSGYWKGIFRATSFTNVDDICVPHSFVYEGYRPSPDGKTTNDLRKVLTIEGSLSSLVPELPHQQIAPFKITRLEDMRHLNTNIRFGVFYTMTDGELLSMDSQQFQDGVAREVERARIEAIAKAYPEPSNTSKKWLSRALLASVLVGFPLVFLLGRKNKPKQIRKEK